MRRRTPLPLLLIIGFALGSCQEYNLAGSTIVDTFEQVPAAKADILFVMDNSVSMVEEQDEVAANFQEFIANIEETNADWQIGVTTTDMVNVAHRGRLIGDPLIITPDTANYQEAFAANIKVGTDGHPIERGLSAAVAAVTPPLTTHENEGFVRDDAQLTIIIVTDENDCSDNGTIQGDDQEACHQNSESLIPVPLFVHRLRAIKEDPRDVSLSAIVELDDDSGFASCGEAATGHRYIKTASLMGGITRSICDEYDDIMESLGLSVAGIRSSFQLTRVPDVCSIEVLVNDAVVPRDRTMADGWTFDQETNYLSFWGPAIPPRDSIIEIEYDSGDGDPECE